MAVADRPETLADCLAVAGDWLAVGLDPRPERFGRSAGSGPPPPTFDGLVGELAERRGRRLVLTHGGADRPRRVANSPARYDVEVLVAGGIHDLDGIAALRDTGVDGVILGEALLSGAIEYPAALETAA